MTKTCDEFNKPFTLKFQQIWLTKFCAKLGQTESVQGKKPRTKKSLCLMNLTNPLNLLQVEGRDCLYCVSGMVLNLELRSIKVVLKELPPSLSSSHPQVLARQTNKLWLVKEMDHMTNGSPLMTSVRYYWEHMVNKEGGGEFKEQKA